MKKPTVVVGFRKGLVHSVDVVDEPSLSGSGRTDHDQPSSPTLEVEASANQQRREHARFRKSTMDGSPIPFADSHGWSAEEHLAILKKTDSPQPKYIPPSGSKVTGIKVPKRLPRDSAFLLTVEWPLRPGDTRVEAYFIGTNQRSKYWFLIERTIDDLSPGSIRYLSTRTTALIEKKGLEIEEAAILLLRCAWQFERNEWRTGRFFLVTEDGLVDVETAFEIADLVWPEEGTQGPRYQPELVEMEDGEYEREEPITAYGSGYIIRTSTIEFQDNVTLEEFAEAFPFFTTSGWALFYINNDKYHDGFGYRFITYSIKARLGKYLKYWDSYEMNLTVEKPSFPSWLDAAYDPETRCFYFYGTR